MISEQFSLEGKVAVVTGGTGVLGGEMIRGLVSAGVKTAIVGRNRDKGESLARELKEKGDTLFFQGDVVNQREMRKLKNAVVEKWGRADILINAAGGNLPGAVIPPDKNILDLNLEDVKKVVELNYMGTVTPTQEFLPVFIEQNSGVIINISSIAASRPITRVLGYSNSKASIDSYTKWLAVELAHKFGEGIRVNAIAPGVFLTGQNKKLLTEEDGSLTKRGEDILRHTPYNRFGKPEELVGTVIWLCSDASKFVTGTVIHVDGGFTAYGGF